MRSLATQLARRLTADTRTDGDLVAGFLNGTDDDFAELVRRHGAMVWGVCRRLLPNHQDAEDAFQAVFLVLVRKARRLAGYSTVGPWLHRVAAWTSHNVRRRNARRSAKTDAMPEHVPAPTADPDLSLDIDSALLALPEKYRSPIVLCHLLGLSRAEAAGQLGCPEGTLSAWLNRGLAKLRARLNGYDPMKALAGAGVAVPATLPGAAVRAAVASRAAVAVTASTASTIAEGVIRMFWVKKATAASFALFAVFAMGVGVGVSVHHGVPAASGQGKSADDPSAKKAPPAAEEVLTRELNEVIRAKEASVEALKVGSVALGDKFRSLKAAKADPKQVEAAQAEFERVYGVLVQAAKELDELKKRLADQRKSPPTDPTKLVPAADVLADIDKKLTELKAQFDLLTLDRKRLDEEAKHAATKAQELDRRAKELSDLAKKLTDKRAELAAMALPAKTSGFVEVTLRGEASKFVFTIRETDANGKDIGTVVVREPEMLTKLLTRIKNDQTAPKELRVVAEPPTANGGGPAQLFKACDAAGYKTVKYTGYVIGGGFTPQLKAGQKGEMPGYRWYDGAEKSPADLLKEHGEGMLRF